MEECIAKMKYVLFAKNPFVKEIGFENLPCNHSFHVGCIDRWLSGTHSHNECFTAGCPTCKKRPTVRKSTPSSLQMPTLNRTAATSSNETNQDDDMSGSLPSWAFANLGSVMAMSSGDVFEGH